MENILFAVIISLIAQGIKGFIKPKFGDWGVRVFVLILALGAGALQYWAAQLPVEALKAIGSVWMMSAGFYALFIKNFEK